MNNGNGVVLESFLKKGRSAGSSEKFLKNIGRSQGHPLGIVCGREASFVRRFEVQVSAIRVDHMATPHRDF